MKTESIRSGALDRRITIFAMAPPTDDGMRSKSGGWFRAGDRWASLTPLSGAERIAAAENEANETLQFRVRRDSLTVGMDAGANRIGYGKRWYDLQLKQEVGKRGFDLLVTGRADEPAPEGL